MRSFYRAELEKSFVHEYRKMPTPRFDLAAKNSSIFMLSHAALWFLIGVIGLKLVWPGLVFPRGAGGLIALLYLTSVYLYSLRSLKILGYENILYKYHDVTISEIKRTRKSVKLLVVAQFFILIGMSQFL